MLKASKKTPYDVRLIVQLEVLALLNCITTVFDYLREVKFLEEGNYEDDACPEKS